MRILLTGSNGFLGQKLTDMLLDRKDVTLLCTSRSANRNHRKQGYQFAQISLTDIPALAELIQNFTPTHIVHTAAISSVEACEADPEQCTQVNVEAPRRLAEIAKKAGIHFTFLSTDFVFDGKNGPYTETDSPQPCNAYGQSKWDAEQAILAVNDQAAILRTILVYGLINDPSRSNLVLWAKGKLEKQEPIQVVADQWRMPTWVEDLASACLLTAEKQARGIYHISSSKLYSILELVQQVATYWNLDQKLITAIPAASIGQDKNRPMRTGFILDKAIHELGFLPSSFMDSLQEIDKQLKKIKNDE